MAYSQREGFFDNKNCGKFSRSLSLTVDTPLVLSLPRQIRGMTVCFRGNYRLLVGDGVFTLPDTDTDFTFTDTGPDADTMGFKPNCIGVGVGQCEHTMTRGVAMMIGPRFCLSFFLLFGLMSQLSASGKVRRHQRLRKTGSHFQHPYTSYNMSLRILTGHKHEI